ncbi:hypothetical protein [Serratia liquefaciens]|uniref:hypothetical protein n=1 Tax=Serratia liquefaciens TaxID=614 RepID=UPI003906A921
MKMNTAFFHKKGFYVTAPNADSFWVLLSRTVGWGLFVKVREETNHQALFELSEVLPADSKPPGSVVEGSNVLWSLQEALEVLQSVPSSQIQAYLQRG